MAQDMGGLDKLAEVAELKRQNPTPSESVASKSASAGSESSDAINQHSGNGWAGPWPHGGNDAPGPSRGNDAPGPSRDNEASGPSRARGTCFIILTCLGKRHVQDAG